VAAMTARIHAGRHHVALPFVVIVIGQLLGSTGPLFVRVMHVEGMPTPAIIALRQVITSALLTPVILLFYRHELRRLSQRNLVFAALAGSVLAIRFYFQIEAFNHSSVLLAGVFGGSGPLWVAIVEVLWLRAVFSRRVWAGISLSLVGGVIIALAGFDSGTSPGGNALLGAGLGLTAAFMSAFYLNFGRMARGQVSLLPYLWLIFSIAAVISLAVALLTGVPLTGYSDEAWSGLLGLIITAQIFGHGAMNFALKYMPATYVSVLSQIVVVTSAVGAYFYFNEQPGPGQAIGSLVIVAGVIFVTFGRSTQKPD
ncbi:MAG: DMT family transporter, partial [Anaerolineaceae bacterium]|nr:DMT family transporter [Anaerolineaceae bacterium]